MITPIKKILSLFLICITLFSCGEDKVNGTFKLSGEIKNVPDQKIFLEQLFFNEKQPEIIDTAEVKNGKFSLSGTAAEEGMYRLKMEKAESGFIFINDKPAINFKADINDVSLSGPSFNTPANLLLKDLIINLDKKGTVVKKLDNQLDSLHPGDSIFANITAKRGEAFDKYKNFLIHFIDTASDPVVAMFALGYARGFNPKELSDAVPGLSKRFRNHKGVQEIVTRYNQYIATLNEPKPVHNSKPGPGDMAPDLTMTDIEGKSFSLSELKGKFVLVDFWASWCRPCRAENPNVLAAYNKYKDKNFTVLGVSLDENKTAWINAIKQDQLSWKQVSDLKQWNSAAVPLYGFDGIPYNVLIDPAGKIIATELREEALQDKLEEVLK